MKRRVRLILALGLLAYAATGLCFVQPDEQVIVRRFGEALTVPREPGAHFGFPWGLDRIDRIKPREVKRVTIGPINVGGEAVGSASSQLLTGDRNLVNVRATVQYTIKDARQYLFQTDAVDPIVAAAGEAAVTEVLSTEQVDRALTLGKQELAVRVRDKLQVLVDKYSLGITIRSVDIGSVQPPPEVAGAFENVISAQRQREQQINHAESYANRATADANAAAQRIRDEARRDRDRSIRQAEGESRRFERLLTEYDRSPELTARRMYLETMSQTLPKFRSKLIIDTGSDLDLSIIREENR